HKAGYAHFGWDFHKHMDMICAALCFQNPYAFPLTQLSQNTAYRPTLLSVKRQSSVFRRKNYVIFTVPAGVR
ncbi:putative peptide synthetase, partial [Escherichia coli M056]